MARKNLPGYLKHKATGQAICVIHGKTEYLGKYGSKASREKYEKLIADYLANDKKPLPVRVKKKITVEELAVRFLDYAEGYYVKNGKPTETALQCRLALAPLVLHYGDHAAADFGPLSLAFVRDKMIEEGYIVKRERDGKLVECHENYTRETINARISTIRHCFRWGVSRELVTSDVLQALEAVENLKAGRTAAPDNPPVPPVPVAVIEATLPFLPPIVADMVRVQWYIGGRPQDVCNMRACDIERTGDVWAYRPHTHKTEHRGKILGKAIGPRAQEILVSYLTAKQGTPEAYLFSPADSVKLFRMEQRQARKSKVQPSQRNRTKTEPKRKPREQYNHYSYRQAVERAVEKYNARETETARKENREPVLLPHWTPNQLRHNAGTDATAKFSLEAAKEFLGHSSIKTTEKYYVAPLPELAAKVAREIG